MMRVVCYWLLLLAAWPLSALAQRPDYNYLDVGYVHHRLGNDCVQDGLEAGGSLEVTDRTYVLGHFSDVQSNKRGKANCGSGLLQLGAGLNGDFTDVSTFYAHMSLVHFSPREGGSELGWSGETGLRGYIAPHIETRVRVGVMDVGPISEIYLKAGGVYWFEVVGLYFDAIVSEDDTTGFTLGARFTF